MTIFKRFLRAMPARLQCKWSLAGYDFYAPCDASILLHRWTRCVTGAPSTMDLLAPPCSRCHLPGSLLVLVFFRLLRVQSWARGHAMSVVCVLEAGLPPGSACLRYRGYRYTFWHERRSKDPPVTTKLLLHSLLANHGQSSTGTSR